MPISLLGEMPAEQTKELQFRRTRQSVRTDGEVELSK